MGISKNTGPSFFRAELSDHPRHGPLPLLLLALTVVTGVVDAVSIISLGHVFVANMTGNVVFAGFAAAGAPGFSLAASAVALAGFLVGAGIGGMIQARLGAHRGVLLSRAAGVDAVLLAVAAAVTVIGRGASDPWLAGCAAAVVAAAMGLQNAIVRGLSVPDLTTTVLTMTLTGIAADLRKRDLRVAARRGLSVMSMFVGAAGGALLDMHAGVVLALGVAAVLIAVVGTVSAWRSRRPEPWQPSVS